MVEIEIDAQELKSKEESKIIEKFVEFVKDKTAGEVTENAKALTVKGEGPAITKKYLRIVIKKFLHAHKLDDSYRVIGDDENALKVKERKVFEA
jgi:hypothetical protein